MNFQETIHRFSNKEFLPRGWYWLLPSCQLKQKKAVPIEFFKKKLVLFRGESGVVHAMDAKCPHMGAHLCDGTIEGDSIRCPFHFWKFNSEGRCTDIPVQKDVTPVPKISTYIVREYLGLIWVWTGNKKDVAPMPVPEELEGAPLDFCLGKPFEKRCHPNVVMVNAIDAHHFTSVHQLVVDLNMEPEINDQYSISFDNTTPCPDDHILFGKLKRFYKRSLTYHLKYWWGHTGVVTLGPDFLHFHIMFALRPGTEGQTQGQTILITKKRQGLLGKIINGILLRVTRMVGNYFAKGDTIIFERIQFEFRTPIKADRAILHFVRHYERLKESDWSKPRNLEKGSAAVWEDSSPITPL